MSLKDFFANNRELVQILYGVVLIILIPLLLAYNTITIIQRYNNNIDITLQRHVLTIGRTINALVENDIEKTDVLQSHIEKLTEKNNNLEEISVLFPSEESFVIKSSSNQNIIGEDIDYYYFETAWRLPENEALVTDSIDPSLLDQSKTFSDPESINRFWLVTMPLSANGEKKALLSLKVSSEIVDNLTEHNRNVSIIVLIATIFIIILFLLAAVRLWDYALLYKKIKEVDQMKDEFISIASHELRTPITGIKGYSSMMLDGTLGEVNNEVKNGATIINNAANRLAVLVEDLLNVSRIEQNRLEFNLEKISPKEVIESTIEELAVQANKKDLELNFLPHKDNLPAINIDKEKLKQILINLIGNSIKYTQKGKIDLITEEKNEGKTLEIRIKDTGIGMSAKAREKLFQKFYRVKTKKTEKITGTGLGLWITKQLVEKQKGKIFVDSIVDVGTQMTLQFPIVKKDNNK